MSLVTTTGYRSLIALNNPSGSFASSVSLTAITVVLLGVWVTISTWNIKHILHYVHTSHRQQKMNNNVGQHNEYPINSIFWIFVKDGSGSKHHLASYSFTIKCVLQTRIVINSAKTEYFFPPYWLICWIKLVLCFKVYFKYSAVCKRACEQF